MVSKVKKIEIPIEKLIEQYNCGCTTKYLSQFYNCSVITIQRRLKDSNCKFRPIGHGSKKYSINKNYFDIIDTEEKAYWLGIMLTDGSTSANLIRLSFKKKDEGHLKKFLKSINSNHPIKYQEKDEFIQACISIGNKHMRESLMYKGIISNNKRVYKTSEKLEKHYWRGAIDGDGKIDEKRQTIGLVGTKETCMSFKEFCQKHTNTKANVKKHGNIWSYRLHGNPAFDIAKTLYNESSIYLDRKYVEYMNWLNAYDIGPLYPKVVRYFKKVFSNTKISILRCKMPSSLEGDCTCNNGKYYIRIDKNLNDNEAINCLLHELSHIHTMLKQNDSHGTAFGIAYSKIYKLYESEFTTH